MRSVCVEIESAVPGLAVPIRFVALRTGQGPRWGIRHVVKRWALTLPPAGFSTNLGFIARYLICVG